MTPPTNRELTLSPNKLRIVDRTNTDPSKANSAPQRRFKVVFLGNISVGKTALLGRIIAGKFGTDYGPTIVGDIYPKTIKVDTAGLEDKPMTNVEVMFYDTSGNDRYALFLPDVMTKASAAVVVYSVADRRSFDQVDNWLERFRHSVSNCCLVILVASKIDRANEVTTVEGEEKASRLNALFCQVSAKSGQNVDELIRLLGTSLLASAVNQRLLITTTSQPSAALKQIVRRSSAMSSESVLREDHFTVVPTLLKYKIAILGERAVGKTSMLTRFLYDSFDPHYQSTIGIDFFSKNVRIEGRTDVRLQLWDTAGQERFRSLIPSYIRNSNAAIIVYDITDRHSFSEVKHWVDEVHCVRGSDAVIMLAANKIDLRSPHCNDEDDGEIVNPGSMVTTQEGEAKAREIGAFFIEISAKTGYNVQQLFRRMAVALPESLAASASQLIGAGPNQDIVNVEAISTDENADMANNQNSSCSC